MISRRNFMQIIAGATIATATGVPFITFSVREQKKSHQRDGFWPILRFMDQIHAILALDRPEDSVAARKGEAGENI